MNQIIEFSGFRIDKSSRELYRNNKKVSIQNKPYELLLYLIDHNDRAVSKDELINEVWQGSVISDSTLSHAVFKLRASLRDHKGKEKIIRTVRGFGVQFIATLNKPEYHNETDVISIKTVKNPKNKWVYSLIPLVIIALLIYALTTQPESQENKLQYDSPVKQKFVFIPNPDLQDDEKLIQGITVYMNQLIAYSESSDSNLLLALNTSSDSPQLSSTDEENKIYASYNKQELALLYNSKNESFKLPLNNISDVVNNVSQWVCQDIMSLGNDCKSSLSELTNDNEFILENYLRGIDSQIKGQHQKAINYFNICLQEDSTFRIARYAVAKSFYSLSQYKKSIAQLQTIITTAKNKKLIQQTQVLLGKNYFRTSEYDKSETAFLKVVNNNSENYSIKAYAMIELAQVFQETNDLLVAFNYANEGNVILKDMRHPGLLARSYKIMGSINNAQGNLDEAQVHLSQALNIYEDLDELNGIEAVLSQLGSIFQAKGDLSTSLAYATRRQAIVNRLGDPIGIAGSHLQLSYLLLEMGNLEKATNHANQMWEVAASAQEPRAQMMASLILGEISNAKSQTQQSLDHYSRALVFSRDLGLKRREIIMLCNMGKVAIDGKLPEKAEEFLFQCKDQADQSDYTLFQSVARLYLGELYNNNNQKLSSENQLNEALEIAQTLNNEDIIKGIQLEYFYLYIPDDLISAEHHLQLVPDNYKESYLYLIAKAELEFKKQNFEEAHNDIIQAKLVSGDNWSNENETLLTQIKSNF